MKTLVVFATLSEAESSLEALKAKVIIENELFETDIAKILICGIGSLNAAIKTLKYYNKEQNVLNLGACGALKEVPIFTVLPIKAVHKLNYLPPFLDSYSKKFSDSIFSIADINSEGFTCLTSDFPLHQEKLRDKLKKAYDCIDMEGYGIARACKEVKMFKCVSDFASKKGHKLIKEHLKEVSFILKETLIKTFN
jgi:nucleoside phosphorylase